MRKLHFVTLGLALLLVGAVPIGEVTSVEELLRRGSEAFEQGDYAAAVEAFTRLEDLTDDPGQSTFNKAAAQYRLALQPDRDRERVRLLREAGENYKLCLEDAEGRRKWAALFGLGNTLLQQHPAGGPRVLFDAVACYEQVLAAADAEQALKDDARHNLELARLLWAKQRKDSDPNKPPQDNNTQDPPRPDTPPPPQDKGTGNTGGSPDNKGQGVRVETKPGETPVKVPEATAGANELPPVPEDESQSLSPDDARTHLKKAMAEIRREKLEHQRKAAQPPARGVKDW